MTRYGSETYKFYSPRYWLHSALCVLLCCSENPLEPRISKSRQLRPHDVNLTPFLRRVKFVPPTPNLICNIINIIYKEKTKDGCNGLNRIQLFALCLIVVNFAFCPFCILLGVQKASFNDGVFKFFVSCA